MPRATLAAWQQICLVEACDRIREKHLCNQRCGCHRKKGRSDGTPAAPQLGGPAPESLGSPGGGEGKHRLKTSQELPCFLLP